MTKKQFYISIFYLLLFSLVGSILFLPEHSLQKSIQFGLLILFFIFCYRFGLYHKRLVNYSDMGLGDIRFRLEELSESIYCECGHSDSPLQTIYFLNDGSIKNYEDEEFAKIWGVLNNADIALTLKSCKECQKVTIKQPSK